MIFTCRPTTAKEEETCAADIVKRPGGAGVPRRGDGRRRRRTRWRSTSRAARSGDFESGIRMALQAMLASPRFLFRLEQAPADGRDAGADLPRQRLGPGVAAVVLPLGHGARRRAAEGGERRARCARRPGSRSRCGACWPIARSEALATRFAAQWLRLQDLEKIHPDYLLYPAVRRHAGAGDAARDRAVLRQHRARGPQRARPADRRLHLRQRAAGEALRHPERHRHRVPARAGARRTAAACSARAAS